MRGVKHNYIKSNLDTRFVLFLLVQIIQRTIKIEYFHTESKAFKLQKKATVIFPIEAVLASEGVAALSYRKKVLPSVEHTLQ